MDPKHDWVESDDEFEGVGAHPNNPRYNHDDAVAERETYSSKGDSDAEK